MAVRPAREPAVAPAAAPSKQAAQQYHVKPGDNLSKVSKLFYGNPNKYGEIASANGISNPRAMIPGQVLKIPAIS